MKEKFREDEYAFSWDRSTTDLTVTMRQLTEKCQESGKNVVMVFIKKKTATANEKTAK
jgi:hypothetical protein